MQIQIFPTAAEMSRAAAARAAQRLREQLAANGEAVLVLATGTSQLGLLEALVREEGVAWEGVTCFHLDEYVGLPASHPASFRNYLWNQFFRQLPVPPRAIHFIQGDSAEPEGECQRLARLLGEQTVHLALVGIGENGHLAFNDPPADFETRAPYLVVQLDEACRQQQTGEGWFPSLDDVPRSAITMGMQQILQAQEIVCTVPEARKALAVQRSLEGSVTPEVPASLLQTHPQVTVFLDEAAACLLLPTSGVRA